MRYSFISAAVLAFVSSVSAGSPTADFDPMTVPSSKTDTVAAGSTYTIKWTAPAKYNGTVTLKLLEGASAGTLTIADQEIDSGVDNSDNSYDWDIPADIESFALYGIQISWDADPTIFQWSFPFHIIGSSSSSTSSSATGPVSTKTVQVSPVTSSTSSATSTSAKTTSSASTNSTTVVIVTSSTSATAASNGTLSTSGSLKPTAASTSSSRTTTSPAAATSTGAAMANLAKGSFAVLGGAVLALVL